MATTPLTQVHNPTGSNVTVDENTVNAGQTATFPTLSYADAQAFIAAGCTCLGVYEPGSPLADGFIADTTQAGPPA
jgi:hypothetical protein